MRSILEKHLSRDSVSSLASRPTSNSSLPFAACLCRQFADSATLANEEADRVILPRERPGVSYGLNCALAGRGVIVKDKAYYNLKLSKLQKFGASAVERLSGHPLHVRGNVNGGVPEISKAQFKKLLKQVTSHLSSISSVFVQDGAVGSIPKCDAKVRVISDSSSAVLQLSKILWKTQSRAISHDSCPMTVYIASSISPSTGVFLGLGSEASNGCAAVDVESSSLILCGKLFSDDKLVKSALSASAAPIISARGGIPLFARLLVSGDSIILLFVPEDTMQIFSDFHEVLVSLDVGVVLSSHEVAPFFPWGESVELKVFKKPSSIIFASSDSTGVLPLISKLSPSQAAYHFLAGYRDGKFVPAYSEDPSPIDPIALAKTLYSQLKENEIQCFLINVNDGGKPLPGKELVELMKSTLSNELPVSKLVVANSKVGYLKGKYNSFLSGKFEELPDEFFF